MMKWYGARAKANARQGAAKGLEQWADLVLKGSQEQVPVSPWSRGGFLKSTGKADVDEGALRGAVSYDSGAGWAVYVHERMDTKHSTGKAKFLEDPLNASKSEGRAMVAAAIRGKL